MQDTIIIGDSHETLKTLPSDSVDCCITSPPYYALREYGIDGQIGQEETPDGYIEQLSRVFDEVFRLLKPTGTLFVNISDSYAGSGSFSCAPDEYVDYLRAHGSNNNKHIKNVHTYTDETYRRKCLLGIPYRLAFSLIQRGWYLRQDLIWAKPNCQPESVKDRWVRSHEHVFFFSKEPKYYFDISQIREYNAKTEQYRTQRDVIWQNVMPSPVGHIAAYPEALIQPFVLAACPADGLILDPFLGSGTTAVVALKNGRHFVGVELNPEFARKAEERVKIYQTPLF